MKRLMISLLLPSPGLVGCGDVLPTQSMAGGCDWEDFDFRTGECDGGSTWGDPPTPTGSDPGGGDDGGSGTTTDAAAQAELAAYVSSWESAKLKRAEVNLHLALNAFDVGTNIELVTQGEGPESEIVVGMYYVHVQHSLGHSFQGELHVGDVTTGLADGWPLQDWGHKATRRDTYRPTSFKCSDTEEAAWMNANSQHKVHWLVTYDALDTDDIQKIPYSVEAVDQNRVECS